MPTEHVNIADGERHEPKGIASALDGQIYECNGSESGAWRYPRIALTVKMSTIATAQSVWVVSPIAGTIEKIYSVMNGAPTGSAEAISTEIGGVAVTNGGLTLATGGSAGDVDSATPTALNTVAAGQAIEIISAGNSGGTVDATFTIYIKGSTS